MMTPHHTKWILALCLFAAATVAEDTVRRDVLPEGPGLSAAYPGDAGIEKDPAVLFADNFESGDLKRWDDKGGNIAVVSELPHTGAKCVQSEMLRGKNNGGEAKKWFMPGNDTVYARVYVKFSADYQYVHHFLWLSANLKTNKWSSFGKAGNKPDGTYFSTGMEPWFAWGKNASPGELNMYTYYMDMDIDKKMNKYWGNGFFPKGPDKGDAAGPNKVMPKLDTWQCWEFMLKANTPDKADGEQAMWLDGKLAGHFTGIRWRNDAELKVNCFWLEHYGYDDGDPTKSYSKEKQTVWFDDVVIATKYIGPMLPVSPPALKVLLIGNSQCPTIVNNKLLENLAASDKGGRSIQIGGCVKGGASLKSHWEAGTGPETARGMITNGKWDYVVLQDIYNVDEAKFQPFARQFHELIKGTGAKTVLFGTASILSDYPGGFERLHRMHFSMGQELGVPIVDASQSYFKYFGDNPSAERMESLFAKDRAHPGLWGSYLYSCGIYSVLTDRSPIGLAAPATIPADIANSLQEIAWKQYHDTAAALKK